MMNLVIVTSSYPYGTQEAFLEEEIKVLENYFDTIHIYTFAELGQQRTRYVPRNAHIYMVKSDKFEVLRKLRAIFSVFSLSCFKEYFFTRKNYKYTNVKSAIAIMSNYYKYAEQNLAPMLEKVDCTETVFYSYWFSHQAYALACYKKKHPSAFCISRAHGFDNFINRKTSYFKRETIEKFNIIYPISNCGKNEILEKIVNYVQTTNCKIRTSHLGVKNSDILNPQGNSNSLNLVSCSNIVLIKRLDILINALSTTNSSIKINWLHFGSGILEKEIKSMADEKLKDKKNIFYNFMGQTDHEDIIKYYQNNHVDLFVNCSDSEGIPVSIMEAMSAGIPCVARDVGGNSELVDDGINGFLLSEDGNSSDYAEVFNLLFRMDKKRVETIRQAARKKVESKFMSPNVYKEFAEDIIKNFEKHKKVINKIVNL